MEKMLKLKVRTELREIYNTAKASGVCRCTGLTEQKALAHEFNIGNLPNGEDAVNSMQSKEEQHTANACRRGFGSRRL